MPAINFARVADKSSEDTTNRLVADNLLRTKDFKSWKCQKWADSAWVVLETDEPQKVDSIEIGNDGSAFIEVLVANSADPKPRFQVLLSTSSFMTPSDSKSLNNLNRIREFTKDKLSQHSSADKWDRFKIVCKQPFNREISFGVAFVRFNRAPDGDEEAETSGPINFGPFKLRSGAAKESDDQSNTGSLFSKRNNQSDDSPRLTRPSPLASAVGLSASSRNSHDINSSNSSSFVSVKPKQNISNSPVRAVPTSTASTSSPVKKSPPKKARQDIPKKPFNQLMSGVVFVLSGFQNPKRSEIRDRALKMGAKYRADWDNTCSYLICAFANTPKFNEVKAKNGRIVTEKWINDCFTHKKLFSWKKYILGQNTYSDDEEEEVEAASDEEYVPPVRTNKKRITYLDDDEDESEQIREVIGFSGGNNVAKESHNTDNDTNDEIYDMETDNESTATAADNNSIRNESANNCNDISSDPKPIDIFKAKSFCFYGPFEENEKQILTQYIITHSGVLEDDINDRVKYVVTNQDWSDTFEEACASNESLIFVRPKWIHKCHEKSKLIPFQAFIVSSNYD